MTATRIPADVSAILTREEVATILRVNPATVSRLHQRGELAAFRIGRGLRFDRRDVDAFIDRQRGVAS